MTNKEIDKAIVERVLGLDNIKLTNFHPSVLIQDAWLVVAKVTEKGFWIEIENKPLQTSCSWICSLKHIHKQEVLVEANTAPLAICLASLKAVKL